MRRYLADAMQLVTKTVTLALGLPYLIAIAAHTLYGWPSSRGEDRYKALSPQRVYNLNYVLLEQVNLLKWLPLWLKWNQFYCNTDEAGKDHIFGRNGNTLDIWLPDATSSDNKEPQTQMPIVVFIYGGAWGSGNKGMYGLLGQSLANALGCITVVPNYSIYPKGTAPDMLNDIEDTIHFIHASELIKSHSGNVNNIILMGHSAGAHLVSQIVIDLAGSYKPYQHQESQCLDQECLTLSKDKLSLQEKSDVAELENLYKKKDEPLEENIKFNISDSQRHQLPPETDLPQHRAFHSIKGVVGIGGVYHIMDHYHHESYRGVEDLSPMWRVMHGLENFDEFSPTLTVHKLDKDQRQRLPSFLLVHGAEDKTVPLISSEKFADSLAAVDAPVTLKVLVDGSHAELALDMMEPGRTYYDPMIGLIREWMAATHITKTQL